MKRGTLLLAFFAVATALFAQPQASYYTASTLDGKNGRALELALQAIVYPHTRLSYNYLWTAYETTDPGPTDSIPASYTGWNTQLVYDMYAWMQWFPKFYEDGDHSQTGGINREHCVPNSWWGGEDGNAIAYTDLHHLFPADGAANNAKGNYPLGEYMSGLTLGWPTETRSSQGHTYMDETHVCSRIWDVPANKRSNFGGASKVFEPADMYKGDFARAYLYVVCAYEKKLTWQTSQNTMFDNDAQGYTDIEDWALNMLLTWHRNDPVSPKEKDRNNAVEELQGNRNPFIDYPELVEYVWGNKSTQSFSLANATCSYNSIYYPISIGEMDGGTVVASPASALAGDVVTLTAIPDDVHYLTNIADNWNVKVGTTPIAVTPGPNNTATFEMPVGAVTVSVDFTEDPDATVYYINEDFEGLSGDNTTSSGQTTSWNGNDNFPTVEKAYQAGEAVKLGTSGVPGSLTTKVLNLSANDGKFIVAFDVKGWNQGGDIIVSVKSGSTVVEQKTVSYVSMMEYEFETKEILFTCGQNGQTITFATPGSPGQLRRAFLDKIRIYYENDMKTAPASSWSKPSYVAIFDGENELPVFTDGNNEAEPVYSSSNTHVATVDAAAGAVTIHSLGTTTISASTPETETYKPSVQSYVLTVVSLEGDGTEENPFSVADVLLLNNTRTISTWVSGLIVGWADNAEGYTQTQPEDENVARQMLAISDDHAISNHLAVKLPVGAIRSVANLYDNSDNMGKTISVYGTIGQNYYGFPGINDGVSKIKVEDKTQFSISSVEWGTFFTDVPYEMPVGVTGYKADYANSALTLTQAKAAGQNVPANSPLLLNGPEGTYTYAVINSTAQPLTSNLQGNLSAGTIAPAEGMTYYYKLLKPECEPLGWYWGAENGGLFTLGANKAYLALPAEAAGAPMSFFALEDTGSATGIEELTEWQTGINWNEPVYNVLGQSVSRGYHGIVIQHGVKYLAR